MTGTTDTTDTGPAPAPAPARPEPALRGQVVVLIGGSSGIGLETAHRARGEGAEVVLTGRNPDRLKRAADAVGARQTAAFDATDAAALKQFFGDLPGPIDHVMVTAGGPHYGPLLTMDSAQLRDSLSGHVELGLEVARNALGKMRPTGTLIFMGDAGSRRVAPGIGIASAVSAVMPPFVAALALEIAPARVNAIAPGFVDTPLSASVLADRLDARRAELSAQLPIGRVVTPGDVAALAVHLMANTALTGVTYDIDGGQQLVS
ncbi:SDR family oxidoreductase [Catenulispora rubra]|uniref:SDR family oxidoreductase n=1 Tax=Catenulispora rubra TaxID=280293 RepID=UPI0018925567|nr:SDR family oxidoreductase [Catenulispora rubra]